MPEHGSVEVGHIAYSPALQRALAATEAMFLMMRAAFELGHNRDSAWFAAVDTQWPALQTAFEQWLDPATFDAAGCQRVRLSDLTAAILVSRPTDD